MRLIVVAMLVGTCTLAPTGPDAMTGVVTRVIDGDSVELLLDGKPLEVRLEGINAPEHDECTGPEAATHLDSIIASGPVAASIDGKDQYGRSLGRLFVSGTSVNQTMVADGYALAMSTSAGSDLFDVQASAFERGLGLWGESICGANGPRPEISIVGMVANPPGPDQNALESETVTIANEGPTTVNLSHWVIRDESTANRLHLPAQTVLLPGSRLTVSTGCGSSPGIVYWCANGAVWNNSGDTALLMDTWGRVISTFHHGN